MRTAVATFDSDAKTFPGSNAAQARFLLRHVRPLGNVDANLAVLPETLAAMLEHRLPAPQTLKELLRALIASAGLDEKQHLGGSLDSPISTSEGKPALYFVIHDTSSPTLAFGAKFPAYIDDETWEGNDLAKYVDVRDPVAHVFINRAGGSRTGHNFSVAYPATKFENKHHFGPEIHGRFVHVELVQPRIYNERHVDEFAPQPGFSAKQIERLALVYVCASIRAQAWLIPAFHCVLDEGIEQGHDDPQHFSLADWGNALAAWMTRLGQGAISVELAHEHGGEQMTPHPAFLDLAQLYANADVEFPGLKAVTLAHWALASNWGHSQLAIDLNNFANLPYREEMAGLATSAFHAGESARNQHWCDFNSARSFISGYWLWLDRPPYAGWRAHAASPRDFMDFAGSIYAGAGTYADRVLALLPEAESLLSQAGPRSIAVHPRTGVESLSNPKPLRSLTTASGYNPPPASMELLKGIPFNQAAPIAKKYVERFARWDATASGKKDPALCKCIFQLPGGAIVWDSKMAVDADGSPHESVLNSSGGADANTSYMFKNAAGKDIAPINPEIVPYYVLPAFDGPNHKTIPKGPWEGSRDHFAADFGIRLGALGVVIFGGKITGAIFADEGPAAKIGEASIRAHELLRRYPEPWKGDPSQLTIHDVSEEKNVIFFVFPETRFDIDAFGPQRQREMAAAIQTAALAEFQKLKASAAVPRRTALATMHSMAVAPAASTAQPVELFASASSWEGLLRDLNGRPNDPGSLDDDIPQAHFALKAADKLIADFPNRQMMVGFDERIYVPGWLADDELARYNRARDKLKAAGAFISIYHGGAYGATGDKVKNVPEPDVDLRNWDPDEAQRLMQAAKDAGLIAKSEKTSLKASSPADRAHFANVLSVWDNGKWWQRTLAKLKGYKQQGFAAVEVDNLSRSLRLFPDSFAKAGLTGLLGFLRTYADEFAAGRLPAIILKNLSVEQLKELASLVQAADAPGKLPRAMFADFHICEIPAELPASGRRPYCQASARLGIQTVFSIDTYHYRAHGLFGDEALNGLNDIYNGQTPVILASSSSVAPKVTAARRSRKVKSNGAAAAARKTATGAAQKKARKTALKKSRSKT